jgi:PAS domain S-box-containing protein/diguanylate cyclase (GGDEF)-like protein
LPVLDNCETLRAVLEGLPGGFYIVDKDCRVVLWNDAAERITGYLRHEVLGRCRQDEVFEPGDKGKSPERPAFAYQEAMREGSPCEAMVLVTHKAGHQILVHVRAVPIRDHEGNVVGAAESFDESGMPPHGQRREDRMAAAGLFSDLTGLPNREYMVARIGECLSLFSRQQVPFGVLCFQIHELERFRASYGRIAGENILKVVARSIENSLSPDDVIGHWNEGQFLAVLPDCSANIDKVGDRVSRIVNHAGIQWWGDHLSVTVMWAGTLVQAGDSLDSLTGRLERALMLGEATGANCMAQPRLDRRRTSRTR